jgi:hypothetical protein
MITVITKYAKRQISDGIILFNLKEPYTFSTGIGNTTVSGVLMETVGGQACRPEFSRACNLLPMNIPLHTSYKKNMNLFAHNLHEIIKKTWRQAEQRHKHKERIHDINYKKTFP